MSTRNTRSKKAIENDRKIRRDKIKKNLAFIRTLQANFKDANNPYSYIDKVLNVLVDSFIDLQKYFEITDELVETVNGEIRYKNSHVTISSVDSLINQVEYFKTNIQSTIPKSNIDVFIKTFNRYFDNAHEIINGIYLICHDAQVFYSRNLTFSIDSINEGTEDLIEASSRIFSTESP